jgi:hypothetical protein
MTGKWKPIGLAGVALMLGAGMGLGLRPVACFNHWMYRREWLSVAASRNVQVAGVRVHYVVEGPDRGPAVVPVHGLGGPSPRDGISLTPRLKAKIRFLKPS